MGWATSSVPHRERTRRVPHGQSVQALLNLLALSPDMEPRCRSPKRSTSRPAVPINFGRIPIRINHALACTCPPVRTGQTSGISPAGFVFDASRPALTAEEPDQSRTRTGGKPQGRTPGNIWGRVAMDSWRALARQLLLSLPCPHGNAFHTSSPDILAVLLEPVMRRADPSL